MQAGNPGRLAIPVCLKDRQDKPEFLAICLVESVILNCVLNPEHAS